MTFEEFYTLLTQVEACSNTRTLINLYDDIDDIQPLTPAHFLIDSPPARWSLARIIEIFCEKNNLVRVVKLQTATTVLEHPVNNFILISKAGSEADAS